MTVTLTSPAEGKQPGDTYTGPNEAWLLANGYASQAGYTGPGVANTGAASTSVANDNTAHSVRTAIAKSGGTPEAGTNDNLVVGPPDAPLTTYTGTDAGAGSKPESTFDGFANDPPAAISSVTKVDGSAATGLAAAGGTVLRVHGYGLLDATAVQFGGTNGTAFSVLSDRELQVTTPAKAAGSYTVTVVRPEGNLTKATAVTFA